MRATAISSCYVSPAISTEQFIPEHFFLYLVTGAMTAYDGNKAYTIQPGEYGIGRRNHLAKYSKQPLNEQFEKVAIIFDQPFLQSFKAAHPYEITKASITDALLILPPNQQVESFIRSLQPYFDDKGKIDPVFFDLKRSELLLILLKAKPELANIFFDFGNPDKIDLEAFMNHNFRFNVTIARFAYLTGRSLTSFKKDFEKTFHSTPSHWLVEKRLREAHFLMEKKERKASDVYLEVGFEDLSHFSFAFKKLFGYSPTQLTARSS